MIQSLAARATLGPLDERVSTIDNDHAPRALCQREFRRLSRSISGPKQPLIRGVNFGIPLTDVDNPTNVMGHARSYSYCQGACSISTAFLFRGDKGDADATKELNTWSALR